MNDLDRLPGPPTLPTIGPVADDDPMRLMRELRAALVNVGDLVTRLDTKLATVILAELASEREIRALQDRVAALEAAE